MYESKRRKILVFGTEEIEDKLRNLEQVDLLEGIGIILKNTPELNDNRPPASKKIINFLDYILLNPEYRFLTFWDNLMLLIILYSCIVSAFLICFDLPYIQWIFALDIFTTICFILDIIFNLCRQYRDLNGTFVRSHRLIIARYAKSGWLFFDIIATFPLQYILSSK